MSKIEVNTIESQCGSTVTLGKSGDTVTLASGASQSGFGRTGTVDWDTTAKTASFTAVSGNGYFVDTTSSAITVTLPASPSAGDIVSIADYAGTSATNNITIARNGSNFEGGTDNGGISTNRQTGTFVYVDSTQGWVAVNSNDASFLLPSYISATGGTETTCGDYKIHTFTSPGTFTVCSVGNPVGSTTVDYLVVAGGGGGGGDDGGAGGAGGARMSSGSASGCYTASPLGACVSALPVSAQGYPITVGGGGAGISPGNAQPSGTSGSNSIFSTITSTGGGGGGGAPGSPEGPPAGNGKDGGSGGGARESAGTAGSGNTPPVSPPQGNPGGATGGGGGGGGGGATASGCAGAPSVGNGGAGVTNNISGSSTSYAGGGGGNGGTGGTGGGGPSTPSGGTAGTTNTGGGGGGGDGNDVGSGAGGSGIVIIRYKFQ